VAKNQRQSGRLVFFLLTQVSIIYFYKHSVVALAGNSSDITFVTFFTCCAALLVKDSRVCKQSIETLSNSRAVTYLLRPSGSKRFIVPRNLKNNVLTFSAAVVNSGCSQLFWKKFRMLYLTEKIARSRLLAQLQLVSANLLVTQDAFCSQPNGFAQMIN